MGEPAANPFIRAYANLDCRLDTVWQALKRLKVD